MRWPTVESPSCLDSSCETPTSTASRPATPESTASLMSLLESLEPQPANVRALQLLIDSLSVSDDLPPGLFPSSSLSVSLAPTLEPVSPSTPAPSLAPTTPMSTTMLDLKATDTTMMLRNVPYEARQEGVLRVLEASPFKGRYTFFYCPLDFRSLNNLGYAFVNLDSPQAANDFAVFFDGLRIAHNPALFPKLSGISSASWDKPLRVSRARIQGYSANVEHYKNSPVNLKSEEFKPMIFALKPTFHRLLFPAPTAAAAAPGMVGGAPMGTLRPRERRLHAKNSNVGGSGAVGSRVFVGGLGGDTDSMSLWEYMAQFGRVMDAQVLIDPNTGKSRNYGFCTFAESSAATKALENTHHTLDCREIVVRKYTSNK
jgi:hypothetical protein